MATSKGFQPTKQEIAALELAWQRWQEFEEFNRKFSRCQEEPDRQLFTQLGKAVRQLKAALDPFVSSPQTPEIARLALRLQEAENFTHQQNHYVKMLDALCEPLELLDDVTRIEVGGAGRTTDPFERRWILTAIDAWKQVCKTAPSQSSGGRFFQALSAFQHSHGTPTITERNLRSALVDGHRQADIALATVPVTDDVVNYAIGCVQALLGESNPTNQKVIAEKASQQTRIVFGGERLYIPRKNGGGRGVRDNQIKIDHDGGDSVPTLCKRYGLGKSRVWQIIKEQSMA